ncbi:MAG TPA: hypothetical protein VF571_19925 [Pyrinomonadaceae bacterium]|jgi:hypothetical protein
MKILALIFSLFLFNSIAYSQTQQSVSTENFLLTISMEVTGQVGKGCRLIWNKTFYADGRIEQEDCQKTAVIDGREIPVKIENKAHQQQVTQFIQFIEQSGFLSAEKEYVRKPIATDVGIDTIFIYRNQNKEKRVVIKNYDPYDLGIPCFLHLILARLPN